MKKWNLALIAVSVSIVLLLTMLGGWSLHKNLRPCPVITHDTTYVWDTVVHHITDLVPYYIVRTDTIIQTIEIPADVDTAAILRSFFSKYVYERKWEDTLIYVHLWDTITQNKSIGNEFTYKFKKPQTIVINNVDNSITYHSYVSVGLTGVLKDYRQSSLDIIYNGPNIYAGAGYNPYLNGFNIKVGIPIIKFRKTKNPGN